MPTAGMIRDASKDIDIVKTYTYTYPKDTLIYIQIKRDGYESLYKKVFLDEDITINANIEEGIIKEVPAIATRKLTFSVGVPNAGPIDVVVNGTTYTNNYSYDSRTIEIPVGESVSITISCTSNTSVYNSSNTTYIPNAEVAGPYTTSFTMPDEDLSFMYDSWTGPL